MPREVYAVIVRLDKLIARGVRVDIGWGKFTEIKEAENPKNDEELANKTLREKLKFYGGWKYNALGALEQRESVPDSSLKLKCLGTHEKYLVCDDVFAMVGSHNVLTSVDNSKEREIGVMTSDPHIIRGLIERFDSAEDLDTRDLDTSNQKGNFLSTP